MSGAFGSVVGREVGTDVCQDKGGLENEGKKGGFLFIAGRLAVVWRWQVPHHRTPPTTVAPKGSPLGWIMCLPKRYGRFLTSRSSECDLIWK